MAEYAVPGGLQGRVRDVIKDERTESVFSVLSHFVLEEISHGIMFEREEDLIRVVHHDVVQFVAVSTYKVESFVIWQWQYKLYFCYLRMLRKTLACRSTRAWTRARKSSSRQSGTFCTAASHP